MDTSSEVLERMAANVERLQAMTAPCDKDLLQLVGLQAIVAARQVQGFEPGDECLISALSIGYAERIKRLDDRCIRLVEEQTLLNEALSILAEQGALYFAHAGLLHVEAIALIQAHADHTEQPRDLGPVGPLLN